MKKSISIFLSIVILIICSSTVLSVPIFSDTGNHWAKDYIDYLTNNGAIKGYIDGTFKPDNKISRAEFTAILLRAIKNDVGQPNEGKWYNNYVMEATNRKYIAAGEFDNVEKNITRGEMARMIVRTMTEAYPENIAEYASQLEDYSKTPVAYQDFVLKAYVKGIITGRPGGVFAYADPATRAEATTMIVRLIDATKRVIPEEPEKPEDGYMMYNSLLNTEVKVTSSYPEIFPHMTKATEIMNTGEYYFRQGYSSETNIAGFALFPSKEVLEGPIQELRYILSYQIMTEPDPELDYYLPYSIILYDVSNSVGYRMCKELIKDIFPQAYDKVVRELDKKVKNSSHSVKIWEKINGRELRTFMFDDNNAFSMYAAPEK